MNDLSKIRNRILKSRGMKITRPSLSKHRKMEPSIATPTIENKTRLMKLVELQSGKSIEEIILSGSLRHIESTYGIDHSTASKWRKQLAVKSLEGIRNILPSIITGGNNGDSEPERLLELETSSSTGDNI